MIDVCKSARNSLRNKNRHLLNTQYKEKIEKWNWLAIKNKYTNFSMTTDSSEDESEIKRSDFSVLKFSSSSFEAGDALVVKSITWQCNTRQCNNNWNNIIKEIKTLDYEDIKRYNSKKQNKVDFTIEILHTCFPAGDLPLLWLVEMVTDGLTIFDTSFLLLSLFFVRLTFC